MRGRAVSYSTLATHALTTGVLDRERMRAALLPVTRMAVLDLNKKRAGRSAQFIAPCASAVSGVPLRCKCSP